jgi:hypothetical protein
MRNNSFAHSLLLAWGEWHIRQAITEPGWSSISALARMMAGTVSGGGIPGHRILAAGMTPDQARTQRNVMALPESQRLAIVATYCGPKSNQRELAAALGVTVKAFEHSLARGRAAIDRAERGRSGKKSTSKNTFTIAAGVNGA